jgi:predicted O-linked N-acetylglucosamine transferase (SPINDLY family)
VELDPADVDARLHLAALLRRRMRFDEAAAACRAALERAPGDARFWLALGEIGVARLTDEGLREAQRCFERLAELRPEDGEARYWLGQVHGLEGRRDEALRCYREALRLQPQAAAYRALLLVEMQQLCEWDGLDALAAEQRRSPAAHPEQAFDPFTLLSLPSTPAEQLACARNLSRVIEERVSAERGRPAPEFVRLTPRIRVGYLSAEFHAHATAYLAGELFELHDRGRFEVIAYSYGPDDRSPVRRRLEKAFDRFVDLRARAHGEAADAIRADGIEILVDLKGYTAHSRPEIPALRPAPLQVSFLGYPGSMGARFIDYLVGDPVVTPPGRAADFDEKLVILPDCYQPNDRRRAVGATPGRDALGLPARGFVFCGFNQSYKITPGVFAAWMRLLQAVPGSVLWLLEWNRWAPERLRAEARRLGVDPARLVFAPLLPADAHIGRLRAADLFLDTFPVNAHTTASEALWAGLPLVTCMGETFASRVAASLLSAARLPQLAARSLAEYEALALRLARAPDELAAMRAGLEGGRTKLPLFDTPRFVGHLEAAYEQMSALRAAGEAPRQIVL